MPYTQLLPNSFVYVDHDVADGDSLVDWRRHLDAERRANGRARRSFHLPRLRFAR